MLFNNDWVSVTEYYEPFEIFFRPLGSTADDATIRLHAFDYGATMLTSFGLWIKLSFWLSS